ncbi:transcription factor NF-E2 45 kDa subunit isoform X2 [Corythoichthys intestinalis]|uniref:transcription factor NF-E2 45 kDa subunit isoform X2 n=1 Tax=Corythoichthys intestinalis TaxID=161448 RepID=UPI0025A523E7|nr:transcription factor NF-E2 45 kDa subunit isoform X2 [Corythoichthys intestinalis]
MCSTANYEVASRRTSEGFDCTSSRLCGAVTANFLGGRSHGAQHTDMDATWQELMAITELQGFEPPCEASYGATHYQSIEPIASLGTYGATHCHSEPATFEVATTDAYDGGYSEEAAVHPNPGSDIDALNKQPGPQLTQRMLATSSQPHQSILALTEQRTSSSGTRRPNGSLPLGHGQHMWTAHSQSSFTHSADDLESDSGLSLGSSPPLTSPETSAFGASSVYRSAEIQSMGEHFRRGQNYSIDYQPQSDCYLQTGAQHSYFTTQHLTHSQYNTLDLQAGKQTLGEVYTSELPSRGSWQHVMHPKRQGSSQTPGSRDERRAIALKIPFPMEKIINLPVDDFNELLTQYTLTDAQLALIKDIRRRGKNKVAAQNCRKRKLDTIIHLERELGQLQTQRDNLVQERLQFRRSLTYIKCHFTQLYTEVFSHLRDETGQPYSKDEYHLQQMADGETYLVPHTTMPKQEC